MVEMIYATHRTGLEEGRVWRNAKLFDGKVEPGVSKVIVVGDRPRIVAAYRAAGVEVEEIGVAPRRGAGPPAPPKPVERYFDLTEIPEDWRELSWQAKRALAKKLTDVPVINSAQANVAIEAEIERRRY